MATVTIELDDAVFEKLVAEAGVGQESVSTLIAELAASHAAAADAARSAARRHLLRYPRLFQRLSE